MKGKETKHVREFVDSKLKPGERVLLHLEGWIGEMMGKKEKAQRNGSFLLTKQRACFYRKGLLGEVLETIPVGKITSVESLSRLGYRVLRLHTSHDSLEFKTFESKSDFELVLERIEEVRDLFSNPGSGEPAGVSPGPAHSIPEQIQELAKLRDAGILTEEEFSLKKADLLNRM